MGRLERCLKKIEAKQCPDSCPLYQFAKQFFYDIHPAQNETLDQQENKITQLTFDLIRRKAKLFIEKNKLGSLRCRAKSGH